MYRDPSLTKDFLKVIAIYIGIQAVLVALVWLLKS